ncbi:hypothetical protein [Prescottella subtropica]|uniref:hypothetical protein n=1 Tax=Prescottella subtropica TaxID=2545757 RepID=UPI00138666BE|nr:hypothetical protein [Prescottella subtropica]
MNLQFWELRALANHLRNHLVNARRFLAGWRFTEIPATELPRTDTPDVHKL